MAENPIKYNDLFDPDVKTELDGLKGQLKEVQDALQNMIAKTKDSAGALKKALDTDSGGDKAVNEINQVYEAYGKMKVQLTGVTAELKKLDGESESVAFTQKEINKIVKLGNEYNAQRGDSYSQLSKKYSAMKILINQLTQAERENTEEGRALVKQSKEIYEQMNAMQQATGKYQLQVGQYTKAFNGLNLATQQVVRELPVMAFGFDRFIMAISNNLPILGDAIREAKKANAVLEAQRKAMLASGDAVKIMQAKQMEIVPVTKQIIKSFLSWQTVMVGVLTILPGIIKSIKDKKKALKEQNEVMKETVSLESTFFNVQEETHKGYRRDVQGLEMLYLASQDVNRSKTERIKIAQILKREYEDEFANFSAEAIYAGKAKDAYDKLTDSMHRHSRAKAIMNIMTKNEEEKIMSQLTIEHYAYEHDINKSLATIKTLEKERKEQERWLDSKDAQTRGQAQGEIERIDATINTIKEANKEYFDALKQIGDIDKVNAWLLKQMQSIDFESLFPAEKIKKAAKTEDVAEILGIPALEFFDENNKYFRQAWKAEIDLMEDGMDKELAMNDYKYQTMLEDLSSFLGQQELLEQEGRNTISTEQMEWIRSTIDILKSQYYDKMTDIQKKWLTKMGKLSAEIPETKEKKSFLARIFGFDDEKDLRRLLRGLERAINITIKYMNQWMDMRIEMAHIAVESAQKEVDATKRALDLEQEARVNGYAHNVGLARREYEEKLALKKKAVEEEQRLAKIQQEVDAALQVSSLLVATANLWAGYSKLPIVGKVLAGIATASMWASFTAAQIQASKLVKAKQYGEGMTEYLDYGGSHASGNDIDFGTMKDGTRRRVERGEMIAVINKKNVNKYGADNIASIMNSLNTGTFEDKYGLAFAGMSLASATTDLTELEDGMRTLVKQGERKVAYGNGCRVEYYRNRKRIIRS